MQNIPQKNIICRNDIYKMIVKFMGLPPVSVALPGRGIPEKQDYETFLYEQEKNRLIRKEIDEVKTRVNKELESSGKSGVELQQEKNILMQKYMNRNEILGKVNNELRFFKVVLPSSRILKITNKSDIKRGLRNMKSLSLLEIKQNFRFTPSVINQIDTFLSSASSNMEIEMSIGVFMNKMYKNNGKTETKSVFTPGLLSPEMFNNLKKGFKRESSIDVESLYKNTVVEIMNSSDNIQNIRRITYEDGTYVYELKARDRHTISNADLGFRLSKSTESTLDDNWFHERNQHFTPTITRRRERYSFNYTNPNSEYYGIRFDLSRVIEIKLNASQTEYFQNIKYEVELEKINGINVNAQTFENAFIKVMMLSQASDFPISIAERLEIVKEHNEMFQGELKYQPGFMKLTKHYKSRPVNFKLRHFIDLTSEVHVTKKVDGVRKFLYILDNGTYLISNEYEIQRIAQGDSELSGTLIDCEYYTKKGIQDKCIYLFDILFLKYKDLRNTSFNARLLELNTLVENNGLQYIIETDEDFKINIKNYYKLDVYPYKVLSEITKNVIQNQTLSKYDTIKLDGMIFQPAGNYSNIPTKWKPQITIDFLLEQCEDEIQDSEMSYIKFYLKSVNNIRKKKDTPLDKTIKEDKHVVFKGDSKNPFNGIISVENGQFKGENVAYKTVECFFNAENDHFEILKFRTDKDSANTLSVAKDNWDDIFNPITEDTLCGKNSKLYRKYHNQTKLRLLEDNFKEGAVIIDMGIGSGGDIDKYQKQRIAQVYGVDPSKTNLEEFNKRYEKKKESLYGQPIVDIKILNDGFENTEKVKKFIGKSNLKKIDGIVSFFSMTFFQQTREKYDAFLKTINETISIGGKLVGIVMDGERTRDLIERTRLSKGLDAEDQVKIQPQDKIFTIKQIKKFGEYKIHNEYVDKKSGNIINSKKLQHSFGDMISFKFNDGVSVTEQEEYLFYFEPFKRDMEDMGFVLSDPKFLDSLKGDKEFYILPDSSKELSSLYRTFVFTKNSSKVQKQIKYQFDEQFKLQENQSKPIIIDGLPSLSSNGTKEVIYIGVKPSPSNLLVCLLKATGKASDDQTVINIRANIEERKITLDAFKGYKHIYKHYMDMYQQNEQTAYKAYKSYIRDPTKNLKDYSSLPLICDASKVNVIVLGATTLPIYSYIKNYRTYVILITNDQEFYNYIGIRDNDSNDEKRNEFHVQTSFKKDDPIVKHLMKKINE
jgi:hypothetical protein